jgi:hypothetical protein
MAWLRFGKLAAQGERKTEQLIESFVSAGFSILAGCFEGFGGIVEELFRGRPTFRFHLAILVLPSRPRWASSREKVVPASAAIALATPDTERVGKCAAPLIPYPTGRLGRAKTIGRSWPGRPCGKHRR